MVAAPQPCGKGFRAMTADPATYPATIVLEGGASSRRTDPVRARVCGGQQLVNSQSVAMGSADRAAVEAAHLPSDTRGGGRCGPHPGDVLYWVACLGGAGLLLLCATT
jgi:hypothetical protein